MSYDDAAHAVRATFVLAVSYKDAERNSVVEGIERNRQTETEKYRERDRRIDREIQRQRQRNKERERERERERAVSYTHLTLPTSVYV